MVYQGHVKNGVVVLDDTVRLPEGAKVRVEIIDIPTQQAEPRERRATLGQKLLKHVGKAVGLPADAARNHDHYLYGTAKR
ncbi:MAG: hypothetical protein GXP27_01415 [Planctomycetes bacterium]|nr:hypothetical protein [Planctomycetota bacterium]